MHLITPDTDALWDAYLECRYQTLYAPFNLPRTCTTSELDYPRIREGVLHRAVMVLRDGSESMAGVGRLDIQLDHATGPSAQLRYCGVAESFRGSGAGQLLVRSFEDDARAHGCTRLWMEARDAALNFYLRMGYTDFGLGPTKWNIIPHRLLQKSL